MTDGPPLPDVPGVVHSHHRANGVRLHVAEAGEGGRPAVLLLHGWPQHWYEWRHLIPALAPERRVICPDLRGFGWSDAPPSGYDKLTLTRDVLALLDELGVERCGVVGHDWGGWVGFLMCALAPERVERFLAVNIASPFSRPSLPGLATLWRFWYAAAIATPQLGARVVQSLSQADHPLARWVGAGAWSQEERRSFLGQFADPARVRASVQLYRAMPRDTLPRRDWRLPLEQPILMLHGLDDQVVRPVHFAGHERWARDMRVELVADCGHFIAEERPDLVAERARELFGTAPARADS